jgi:low temperature requirement protein LtrA
MSLKLRTRVLSDPPRLGSQEHGHHGEPKVASALELFYDLTFIYLIAQLALLSGQCVATEIGIADPNACRVFECVEHSHSYHACHVAAHGGSSSGGHRRLTDASDGHSAHADASDGHGAHADASDDHGALADDGSGHGATTDSFLLGTGFVQLHVLTYALYAACAWRVWSLETWRRGVIYAGEDALGRLLTFCQMFAVGAMASNASRPASPDNAFGFWSFRFGYFLARGWQTLLVLRAARSSRIPRGSRRAFRVVSSAWCVELALVLASLLLLPTDSPLGSGARETVGLALLLCALFAEHAATPCLEALALRRRGGAPLGGGDSVAAGARLPAPHAEHFVERYSLFMIVSSGECLIHIMEACKNAFAFAPSDPHFDDARAARLGAGLLAAVTVFMVWWLYFDSLNEELFLGGAGHGAFGQRDRLTVGLYQAYHFVLLFALPAFASGLAMLIEVRTCGSGEAFAAPTPLVWFSSLCFAAIMLASAEIRFQGIRQRLLTIGFFSPRRHAAKRVTSFAFVVAAVAAGTNVWSATSAGWQPTSLLGWFAAVQAFALLVDLVIGVLAERSAAAAGRGRLAPPRAGDGGGAHGGGRGLGESLLPQQRDGPGLELALGEGAEAEAE